MYRNPCIVDIGSAETFLLETHLMFVQNSIFSPINLLGDMILNLSSSNSASIVKSRIQEHYNSNVSHNFVIDRIIDNYMMAIIGNSRDEGYMAILRKIFMILLNEKRGNTSALWDLKEFCMKGNECLIDNPFGMNLHNTVKYVICKMILARR